MMPRERTPARRLASGLMPTDSVSTPSAVRRSINPTTATAATQMKKANGSSTRYPVEMYSNGVLFTVVMNPSVMSRAIPRPASMSTRVAMIGCMPSKETRNPFHRPSRSDTRSRGDYGDHDGAASLGSAEPSMMVSATAPDTAMTAPTDRSMPRVAMTIVMPSETSISGAL